MYSTIIVKIIEIGHKASIVAGNLRNLRTINKIMKGIQYEYDKNNM